MNKAIIDVGSNTIRLSIYRVNGHNDFENIMNKKEMVGLAGYIENSQMTVAGVNVTIDTLLKFKDITEEFGIKDLYVLATAPFRNIDNTKDCIKLIETTSGLKIDAISGEKEAKLDFEGAMLESKMDDGLLIDIGGGSTEIVSFKNRKIVDAVSLPIGSLSAYNKFFRKLVPSKKDIANLEEYINKMLDDVKINVGREQEVLGVGGSIRACNKIYMRKNNLKANKTVSDEDIKDILEIVKNMEGKNLDTILKTCPDRIHTILSGTIILHAALKHFKGKKITISNYGVREGYLNSKLEKEA